MDLSPHRPKDVNNQTLKKYSFFSFLVLSFFSFITENKRSISFRVMPAHGWTWNLPMPFPRWMEWNGIDDETLFHHHYNYSVTQLPNCSWLMLMSVALCINISYLVSGFFAWFSHVTLPGLRSSEAWPAIVCGALLSPSHQVSVCLSDSWVSQVTATADFFVDVSISWIMKINAM